MISIHKKTLEITDIQTVRLPRWRTHLTLQLQDCNPTLWYLVNSLDRIPDSPLTNLVDAEIRCYPTGDIPQLGEQSIGNYIGTVQLYGNVWHFFLHKEVVSTSGLSISSETIPAATGYIAPAATGYTAFAQEVVSNSRVGNWNIAVTPSTAPVPVPVSDTNFNNAMGYGYAYALANSDQTNPTPVDPIPVASAPLVRERRPARRRARDTRTS